MADELSQDFLDFLEAGDSSASELKLPQKIASHFKLDDFLINIKEHLLVYNNMLQSIENINLFAEKMHQGKEVLKLYENTKVKQLEKWIKTLIKDIENYLFNKKESNGLSELKNEFIQALNRDILINIYNKFGLKKRNRLIVRAFINAAINEGMSLSYFEQAEYIDIGNKLTKSILLPNNLKGLNDFIDDTERFKRRVYAYRDNRNKTLKSTPESTLFCKKRIQDKVNGAEKIEKLLADLIDLLNNSNHEKKEKFNKNLDTFNIYVKSSECLKGYKSEFEVLNGEFSNLIENIKEFLPEYMQDLDIDDFCDMGPCIK